MRILLIEDNLVQAQVLGLMFEREGVAVVNALDLTFARHCLLQHTFDLIVLSQRFAGINGEAVEGLHALAPTLPFVLVANLGSGLNLPAEPLSKIAYILSRPVRYDDVVQVCRRALSSQIL